MTGSVSKPTFGLLLACFFLSGLSALVYETAWTREFSFVFGTSELAVAAVLAAYMAGLALGAAVAARVAPRLRRPMLAYGLLELGIALFALAVPFGIRSLTRIYVGWLGGLETPPETLALVTALFHLLGAFVVLVPCTACMGATLPLLARHAVHDDEELGPRVGLLYAVNTAGAILGTLSTAFVLLPALGLRHTVWVGVAINALVFVAAALLARRAPSPEPAASGRVGFHWVLPAMALSGAASFAYEVSWARILGYVLGGSTAAFATMLGSFLLGIALGSAAASRLARSRAVSVTGFAVAQLGAAVCAWGAFQVTDRVPAWAVSLGASPSNLLPGAVLGGGLLLPMTLCIGATFPFAVRLFAREAADAAAVSARVYAWNTLGSIVGAVGTGFVLLPALGFEGAFAVAVAANLFLAGVAALASRGAGRSLAVLAAGLALLLLLFPGRTPETLLRTSPYSKRPFQGEIRFLGVGRAATVVLLDDGRRYRVTSNGLPESAIERPEAPPNRYSPARWLGLLPVLARPDTERLLVIGLGGGITLGAVPRSVDRVEVIELESEMVEANRRVPARRGGNPLDQERVRLQLGDARGALMLAGEHYDAIVSQPSHPWTAGASHLYTREFFELAASRLEPRGVFIQWIGLAFVDEELARSLLATLLDVFAEVELFRPVPGALVFAASNAPLDTARSAQLALARSPEDFALEGLARAEGVWAALVASAEGAVALADGAPINTDDHNRLATSRRANVQPDVAWATDWLEPVDPLPGLAAEGDAVSLLRRLVATGQGERAELVADSFGSPRRELLHGWLSLESGRPRAARRDFLAALAFDPTLERARIGLALLDARGAGQEVPGEAAPSNGDALPDRVRALLRAERLRRDGRLAAIAELEPALATWRPGELLFESSARLRIAWRLASGQVQRGVEALRLADALLMRGHAAERFLLRARAAALAGRPAEAWASLLHLRDRLSGANGRRGLAAGGLRVARDLPTEPPDSALLAQLRRAAR